MRELVLDPENALWRDLDADEAARIAGMFQPVRFEAGADLVRQGPPSEHAVVIQSGSVEVSRELPGGQTIRLGAMGPGAVIGELGLLADANRLASVVATEATTAGVISANAFRAGCELLDPALLKVARNILQVMSERLREQAARIAAGSGARAISPATGPSAAAAPGVLGAGFAWRDFPAILPAFRGFDPRDLARFVERLSADELAKGDVIARAGAPAEKACFVLRGAAAAVYEKDGVRHGLNVLGPGELCGASNLIPNAASDLEYVAREAAVVMSLPADEFRALLARDDSLGLGLIRTAAWSLARGFARSNNMLGNFSRLARVQAA